MFIPFIFDPSPGKEAAYLSEFYRSVTFAKKNNWPLIAQSEYFKDPEYFRLKGRQEVSNPDWANYNFYEVPDKNTLNNLTDGIIPQYIIDNLIKTGKTMSAVIIYLLENRCLEFEEWLFKILKNFINKYNENIEAIITFRQYPSLAFVAENMNFSLIYYDVGTYRPPAYIPTVYIDMSGRYNNTNIKNRYNKFIKDVKKINYQILYRKEILSLFLLHDCMCYIHEMDKEPEYEMGISTQSALSLLSFSSDKCTNYDLITILKSQYNDKQLLLRTHPGDPCGASYSTFLQNRDDSKYPFLFICKCRRISSIGSNMTFEAMLWGRTAYDIGEGPYSFIAKKKFSDKKCELIEEEFINFVSFCFYIPYEFLIDIDYLRWRLTNPSELKIYNKHLDYYLACKGVDKQLLGLPPKKRLYAFLESQGFDAKGKILENKNTNKELITILNKIENISEKNIQIKYLLYKIDFKNSEIVKLGVELSQQQAYIENLVSEIAKLKESLDWHINNIQKQQEYIESQNTEMCKLKESLDWHINNVQKQQEYIETQNIEMGKLKESLDWHINSVQKQQEYIECQNTEIKKLSETIFNIENSFSWKITKIFRIAKRIFLKFKRGIFK
jgi:Skp family chaperone for outer membrane proteins